MTFVIAIDGPAGTGKSTVARLLAQRLNFIYVDTGAIYRGLAFLAEKQASDPHNAEELLTLIPRMKVVIDKENACSRIMIDNSFVENELRTEHISHLASVVSQQKKVREALLFMQRNLATEISEGAIFEGRDIATVVFPDALVKIFITANHETRAQRRYEELKRNVLGTSYEQVLNAIIKRDERDENRESAPLKKALDAEVIDSSHMTIEQVIEHAEKLIIAKAKSAKRKK